MARDGATHQCPSLSLSLSPSLSPVGSELPLPRYADVRDIDDASHSTKVLTTIAPSRELCDNPGGKGFVSVGSKLSNVGAAGAAGRAATPTHSYNEESEWDVSGANAVDPASLFGARDEL